MHILITCSLFSQTHFYFLFTLFSSIAYLLLKYLILVPIKEYQLYQPMLMILFTV